jgi:hypothetical protein
MRETSAIKPFGPSSHLHYFVAVDSGLSLGLSVALSLDLRNGDDGDCFLTGA